MPLADYFSRNALAAAQVLKGHDAAALASVLEQQVVGVAWANQAMTQEGRALIDLLVRLLARLYPRIAFNVEGSTSTVAFATTMSDLARAINPNIEISGAEPTVRVAIGLEAPTADVPTVYAGSNEWDALFGSETHLATGDSDNPFGAGAAACFAAANLFRKVFVASAPELDRSAVFSALDGLAKATTDGVPMTAMSLDTQTVLVGCGGVGNATAWALRRVPIRGRIHLVDHDHFDVGNLQRTVLATRGDEGRSKVELLASAFDGRLAAVPHQMMFADFVAEHGYAWDRVLVAVDSAQDRRAVQASLPRWIANAWTQLGDLGVATHRFDDPDSPCLYCAYLPVGKSKNRDELVAEELGVPNRLPQIRDLLYRDAAAPTELLDAIARGRGIARDQLDAYANKPLRVLYTEGVCGGGIVSLATLGETLQEMHVPLAHQSALAGVLLGATLVREAIGVTTNSVSELRIDVTHSLTEYVRRPVRKSTGPCICKDRDYQERYREKWSPTRN